MGDRMMFWARLLVLGAALLLVACRKPAERGTPLELTLAELRTVKGAVLVAPLEQGERKPYVRERLAAGARVSVPKGGLAWLRRDAGETWLLAGPAALTLHETSTQLDHGRAFIDCEATSAVELMTPQGRLELAEARASVEVSPEGTSVYVLRGSARSGQTRATVGESLRLARAGADDGAGAEVERAAVVSWEDWTGGLGTADPAAEPAPFGIGTVGARKPGERGTPRFSLVISRLDVRVTIEHDFALTEVDQTFVNPSSDTVEGLFSFRTPEGAVLRQFGVDRDGELVWGRVKESAEALAQYQSNVYEGSTEDPALLAWAGPGVYSARLYPIEAGASRRVVTRYGQWLPRQGERGQRRLYVYPMAAEGARASLPRIEELHFSLDLGRARASQVRSGMGGKLDRGKVVVQAFDFVPRADLAIELFDTGAEGLVAYRAKHALALEEAAEDSQEGFAAQVSKQEADYIALPLRAPEGDAGGAPSAVDLAIVVDASAATEPTALAIARSMAGSLLAHLGPEDRAALWTGDAALHAVATDSGRLQVIGPEQRKAWLSGLAGVERGGATDIGALLTQAAGHLDPTRRGSVIYIGDGAPSVGELAADALRERLHRLPASTRVLVAAVGSQPNLALLERVTRGAPAEQVHDAYGAARAALRLLEAAGRPLWLGSSVDLGPTVERILPRELPPVSSEQSVMVVGRLSGKPPKQIRVTGSGGEVEQRLITLSLDDQGDLRRRWGEHRMRELLDEGAGRASLVEIGRRFGLISPVTSWYVPTRRELAREQQTAADDPLARRRALRGRWQPWSNGGWSTSGSTDQSWVEMEAPADNKEGGTGTRSKGEEGSMGRAEPEPPSAPAQDSMQRHAAAKGDGADPELARQAALRDAAEFGMIGILNTGAGGPGSPDATKPSAMPSPARASDEPQTSASAPAAPSDDSRGLAGLRPSSKARAVEERFGHGGLGLDGIGEGGGGTGEGIGLGSIGTIGGGGTGSGFGAGQGRLGGAQRTSAPRVRMQEPSVSGALPKEVISRIVRQSFGRFRLCYEQGLASNPMLGGSVSTRFTIGTAGNVYGITARGGSLADVVVSSCIHRGYGLLSFPRPEHGVVSVEFTILFEPAGGASETAGNQPSGAGLGLGWVGHSRAPCGAGADLPLEERRGLWRERLSAVSDAAGAVTVYSSALRQCEARDWRERSLLLVLMVQQLGDVRERVALWRTLLALSPSAADAVYRFMLLRVSNATELRDLHDALGLERIEPSMLTALLDKAKTSAERLAVLRGAAEKFAEDTELALLVLDAYEDAGDVAGGRAWARKLRRRVDATSHVRTRVGEYHLRLAKGVSGEQAERDREEARRTFGEIVEFAPEDPLARRRLGDLLRAHGWYDAALRQYETLQALTPDDPSVALLLGSAAQGMGKTEAAVRWAEKAGASSSPDGTGPIEVAARALSSAFLAWARVDSAKLSRKDELERLRARAVRLAATSGSEGTRVILSWAHPELRPALWTDAPGTMMPAPENHPLLGVAEAFVSPTERTRIELRLDPEDAGSAARLGAKAMLTLIAREGAPDEVIVTKELDFRGKDGSALSSRALEFDGSALQEVVL